MRMLKYTGAVVLGFACCFAVAQETSSQATTDEQGAVVEDVKVFPVTYRLADMPVFSKDGTFKPGLLMAYIESTVSPKKWEAKGGPATMAPYPQNASLVISTTATHHDAVRETLEKLRRPLMLGK